MSKPISLFSGYSQKENRVTNYCLLILKMIYEENPKYLAEVLATLVGEELSGRVGVSFTQQERRASSVPDGLIVQRAFSVYIETKNHDWFYNSQLENHLAALDKEQLGTKVLIALGNFESNDRSFERIEELCNSKYHGTIVFAALSFETLITALAVDGIPKNLADAIRDFRDFLDQENLLPSWPNWLDVVNCAGIPEDVTVGGVYICPAKGGAYTHARCRYFGMYENKAVRLVSEIEAVVDVDLPADGCVLKWNNGKSNTGALFERAKLKANERGSTDGAARVFLLGRLYETNFQKDSPRGMQGSKRYFNIKKFDAQDASELAAALKGLLWSSFGNVDLGE